ncbi:MAG TPA: hypothetical protein VHE78_05840 [Gemmatimonadaceae bacterium]|nr:hypothetical protein [Gemmatimonadaceae bacterium]
MQWAQVIGALALVSALFVAGNGAMKHYSFRKARIIFALAGVVAGAWLYALTGTNEMMAEFGVTPALAWWPKARAALAVLFGLGAVAMSWSVLRDVERRRQYDMSFPRRSNEQVPDADPPKGWKPGM